ncbi:bacteriocin-like protein [Chryseobacterium camelliae]|uniref:bacteriocin-like protein n=1 Tax=Chryseobacterium camelliae TaxID=1265445 RepID=UPI003B430B07
MKNLKKISRNDLKNVQGSKLYPGGSGDSCAQFGLTCGFFQDSNGNLCNRCM